MFCSRLRVRPHLGRLKQSHSTRRSFIGQSNTYGYEVSAHPVRVIGPTIWSVATIGTIYFTCAAYDVYQDAKEFKTGGRRDLTFDDIEVGKTRRLRRDAANDAYLGRGPIIISSPGTVWDNLSGPSRMITGLSLANVAVWGISKLPSPAAQQWWFSLAHTPGYPWYKNRQLFTHMFGHTGAFHLGLNMLALINFGPSVAQSPPFNGSGNHFLAFYLSAGILSSLGAHLSALVFRSYRFTPGMGASGAVIGVFSAWVMTHQETKLRVFPFPMVFAAREMLEWEVAFEALGLLGLWKALRLPINWGHAAHLGGLGVGVAYATYGRNAQMWSLSRRAAFRSMKLLKIV
ncbi:Presenilins-associated rhomboid-like protein, mitochondrial [Cytospora mali]|uniref:Presenilins-associated rhomboid-like protein, mitochondrial n=1 Tax=Cytospora mali TaxID=578113 RepID=A0A194UNG2_CYTMA|nr:Presenilins-associated rhomboid-like protein, mitochondrial [Valsa mali var. pyri (nom. inval.)]